MFAYPYQILAKKLAADIPELRELDWYLQQDSTTDKNAWLFGAPCLFLEFQIVEGPRDHGNKIQSALVDVSVHLLTENVRDKGGEIMKKSGTIQHPVLFDKVYKCLHGFSSKLSYLDEFADLAGTDQDQRVFNSLSRVNIVNPHAIRKSFIKSIQRFRCVVYDHAAGKQYTSPTPGLEIGVTVTL